MLRASKANVKNVKERDEVPASPNKVAAQFDTMVGQGEVKKDNFPVDVVGGTPLKLMEIARGPSEENEDEEGRRTLRRKR